MKFDILFVANARPEFTMAAFDALMRNTDWGMVDRFTVYFYEHASEQRSEIFGGPASMSTVVFYNYGGPVGVMRDYLCRPRGGAEYFVKIDNDFVVCPGWLQGIDESMDTWPNGSVDLLGIEARFGEVSSVKPVNIKSDFLVTRRAKFIGGIGAMRYAAFDQFPDLGEAGKYFGFGQWQTRHPEITKAWIDPPMPCFLLDHLPFEPWKSLSERYTLAGVQRRQWEWYGEEYSKLWEWWDKDWKGKVKG